MVQDDGLPSQPVAVNGVAGARSRAQAEEWGYVTGVIPRSEK
jgi:hypothetical protein